MGSKAAKAKETAYSDEEEEEARVDFVEREADVEVDGTLAGEAGTFSL